MQAIKLTQGKVALVDDEDFEKLQQYTWYCDKARGSRYYATTRIAGIRIRMHNYIMGAKGVDHRDNDPLNNQKYNLRIATVSQNNCNKYTISKWGYKGVTRPKGNRVKPFMARISLHGNKYSLGYYRTVEEAALAYNEAAKKLHGEFAFLNVLP